MTGVLRGLGIDPGGGLNRQAGEDVAHCGWAEFEFFDAEWNCVLATELDAEECADRFMTGMLEGRWGWAAIEEWRLYAEQADRHVGSDFPTVQLIGALKLGARYGARKARSDGRAEPVLTMQPAAIKATTVALLRRRGIQSVAVADGAGGHAKDAETHGWYHLLQPGTRTRRTGA